MSETLRAWLIFLLVATLAALVLWGLPHYVAYCKTIIAKSDFEVAAMNAVKSIITNGGQL